MTDSSFSFSNPFLIFIDGTDGVGKSTVALELASLIIKKFTTTVSVKSIMSVTEIGTLIKNKAISEKDHNEYLNFLGFCYSTFTGIESIYNDSQHSVYIVDRSQASTFAQNICSSELNSQIKTSMLNIFNDLNEIFVNKHQGSYCNFLLELDPAIALKRISASRKQLDNFEIKGEEYQNKIQRCFRLYFEKQPLELLIKVENKTPTEVAQLMFESVEQKLKCHLTAQNK